MAGEPVDVRTSRLLLVISALLWSLGGLLAKNPWIASIPLESRGVVLASYRALVAAACLAPLVSWRRIRWPAALWPTLLAYACMNVLYVTALTRTTAAAAIFLQYTATAWTVVLSWMLLRERAGRGDLFTLSCAVAGIVCIVVPALGGEYALGNMLALASGLAYAGVIVGLRALRAEDSVWLVMICNLVSGLVLLPWALTAGVELGAPQWGLLAIFGVVQIALPYTLFARAVRGVPASEAALLTIMEAALNPFWVWLFVGEIAPAATWVGGTIILAGLVLRYTLWAHSRRPQ